MLCIAVLHSISLMWVINIFFIYIIARYTCGGTFSAIVDWYTLIILFLSCFILNCHGTFLFSQVLNLLFCGIFEQNCFAVVKEIHKLLFSINNNRCRNQIPVIQTKRPLKDGVLSSTRWLWWGRSWLRRNLHGFR